MTTMAKQTNTLPLPILRPDQYNIMVHPAKIKTICAGRRMGKTMMVSAVAMGSVVHGAAVAWVVPTYKNARSFWRMVKQMAANIPKSHIQTMSSSSHILELTNGGVLQVYSDGNGQADGARGEAFDLVIIDEASRVSEETFYDVLLPTIADRDGSIIAPSTPHGKNWFYDEYQRGAAMMDDQQASFHAPTTANPLDSIQRAFKLARLRVPERTFQEEWLAIFQDDGGEVFRNIQACKLGEDYRPVYDPGHRYVMGVDWAQSRDYTVIVVFDATTRTMVEMDRFNQVAYSVQRGRLVRLMDKWKPDVVISELNSIGTPVTEALQEDGYPVIGFYTTNQTKTQIIRALQLAFEQATIQVLPDPALIAELNQFQETRLASGWRFEAPKGKHDDTVIATALAWSAVSVPQMGDIITLD
jgi:hypothetical protein